LQPILLKNLCDLDVQEQIKFEIQRNAQFNFSEVTTGDAFIDKNDANILESPQMVCMTICNGEPQSPLAPACFYLCDQLASKLGITVLTYDRIKINLQFQNSKFKEKYNPPHIDSSIPNHISIVYYIEDSDGDTILFDKCIPNEPLNLTPILKNPPVQGNALVFPSKQFHSSSVPVNHSTRFIINMVLEVSEYDYQKLFTKTS
jgi:hypothetical protein